MASRVEPRRQDIFPHISRPTVAPVREDEIFYYEPDRPHEPGEEFSLTCRRLRHNSGPEQFAIEVFPQEDKAQLQGSIEISVSASNVSDLLKLVVPIEVLTDFGSAMETARCLLETIKLSERISA